MKNSIRYADLWALLRKLGFDCDTVLQSNHRVCEFAATDTRIVLHDYPQEQPVDPEILIGVRLQLDNGGVMSHEFDRWAARQGRQAAARKSANGTTATPRSRKCCTFPGIVGLAPAPWKPTTEPTRARLVVRSKFAKARWLRCLPATRTVAIAQEDAEKVFPILIEQLNQLIRIPENEADRDAKQLPTATRTAKSLLRPFAPQLGRADVVTLPTCDLCVIAVPIRVKQLSPFLASPTFKGKRTDEALRSAITAVVVLE